MSQAAPTLPAQDAAPRPPAPPAPAALPTASNSPLDAESTAWVASFLVHLCLLGLLAVATLSLPGARDALDL